MFFWDTTKNNGFKLISLELTDVKPFGTITYNFIDQNDLQDKVYTTLIIGTNGTSKSNLFRLLIELFKTIDDVLKNRESDKELKFRIGAFRLIYSINKNIYEFTREAHNEKSSGYDFVKNGVQMSSIEEIKKEIEIPDRIITNSFSITDKFPFYSEKNKFENYRYLGIKYNPQSASTKAYLKRTIDFIADSILSKEFIEGLNLIAQEFVGDNKGISITYKPLNIFRFFNGNLTIEQLESHYKKIENDYKAKEKVAPFKVNTFHSLLRTNRDEIMSAIEYCNKLVNDNRFYREHTPKSFGALSFALTSEKDLANLKIENENINTLMKIGLLSFPTMEFFTKSNSTYTLEDASSGEHNLITSLIALLSTVIPNSLIFIDEPEISLHPNWQMRYVSFLKKLFHNKKFNSCHFVIATHSHFLISDLEKESSSIIAVKKENGKIETIDFPSNINTYGWSAEEILYRVFKVRTTRNFYLEQELRELLHGIAIKSPATERMNEILKTIKKMTLNPTDPMNLIIQKAEEYLTND